MKKQFLSSLFTIFVIHISAQTPALLKDINPGAAPAFQSSGQYIYYDYPFAVVWEHGGYIFFTSINYSTIPSGSTSVNNVELWKSDGTTSGTSMVKDIRPGNEGSYPRDFREVNGILYFTADNGTSGRELWKTDGTTAGTTLVKEINTTGGVGGFQSSGQYFYNDLSFIIVWQQGSTFYFTASSYAEAPTGSNSIITNMELWKSDGTASGTVLVKDIYAGNEGSWPRDFYDVNGTLYFSAYNPASGQELWKSDGTTAGTTLVKEINASTGVGGFQESGQYAYYVHTFAIAWTQGNTFYFTASSYAEEPTGSNSIITNVELWKSDGTASGTVLVKDIYSGNEGSYPVDFHDISGTLYFTAYNPASGRELWKSDGTSSGTVLVKEINSTAGVGGFNESGQYGYYNYPFHVVYQQGSTFYFTASSYAETPTGSNPIITNMELWKSDGTTAGTVLVKDIYSGNEGSYPTDFRLFNGTLFFTAYHPSSGRELWKSDGTTSGTALVKEINATGGVGGFQTSGQYWYWNHPFTIVWQQGSVFYFTASSYAEEPTGSNSIITNMELWKSDGTTAGTVLVKDIYSGNEGAFPQDFYDVGGTLYFTAYTASSGRELWKTNGTTAGTALVKEINTTSGVGGFETSDQYFYSAWPFNVVGQQGGTFYFTASSYAETPTGSNNIVNNVELWKSDGTAGGTILVQDIYSGNTGSYPSYFYYALNKMFFVATDVTNGRELWTISNVTLETEEVSAAEWNVYPVPATDVVHIHGPALSSPGLLQISVFDVNGRQVLGESAESGKGLMHLTLDITNLTSGLYFVTVTGDHVNFSGRILRQQ